MIKDPYQVLKVHPSTKLEDIKIPIDIVDVFRPSIDVPQIAEDAIKIKAKVLWLQLGISSDEAKKNVEANNIEYVENKCTKIEYERVFF